MVGATDEAAACKLIGPGVDCTLTAGMGFVVAFGRGVDVGVQLDLAGSHLIDRPEPGRSLGDGYVGHVGFFATGTWLRRAGWRLAAGVQGGRAFGPPLFVGSGEMGAFVQLPHGPFPLRLGLRVGGVLEWVPFFGAVRVPLMVDAPFDGGNHRPDVLLGLGFLLPASLGYPLAFGE